MGRSPSGFNGPGALVEGARDNVSPTSGFNGPGALDEGARDNVSPTNFSASDRQWGDRMSRITVPATVADHGSLLTVINDIAVSVMDDIKPSARNHHESRFQEESSIDGSGCSQSYIVYTQCRLTNSTPLARHLQFESSVRTLLREVGCSPSQVLLEWVKKGRARLAMSELDLPSLAIISCIVRCTAQ